MGRIYHFIQNRPVHLALRDVYYERAVELLLSKQDGCVKAVCMSAYEEILFMLRTARKHAQFAIRGGGENELDHLFCEFMKVLSGNVKAVLSMLSLKETVEHAEGFFLSSGEANRASVALQAEEYVRRARDVLHSVRNTLDLAHGAYEELKASNEGQFNDDERERYERACRHHRERIKQRPEWSTYTKPTGGFG